MKNLTLGIVLSAVIISSGINLYATDIVVDLNNLNPPVPDLYWNGSDLSGGFTNNCTVFNNNYNSTWSSWSGFSYSRVNDTNTAGYGNQYAVISGTDVDSNGTYAVGYGAWDTIISLPSSLIKGFYINNTTYAALDMLNGGSFTKKFGGVSGNDPDWFKITVTGKDSNGNILGSVNFMLADYRFTNNANDYIITDWTWLDLSAIGPGVATLNFAFASSDNGDWGMNTPAYFAMDNLTFTSLPIPIVSDIDNLNPQAPDLYWNGSDTSGGFTDNGLFFNNSYSSSEWGDSWSGFAYSRVNDTNTAGYVNQYAVISGVDVNGNGTYTVGFDSSWNEQDIITLPYTAKTKGLYINNTTYAALDMLNGSGFSKKFGGASGNDPDWFKITVTGKDADGNILGNVDFYLADYRFTNNANDYIITDWTWLDLSAIGVGVKTLHFALSSSDNGGWGMNTPAYFALDDISIEPAFSGPNKDYNNSFDAGVPGFMGSAGDGMSTNNFPSNFINQAFAAWATTIVDYSPAGGIDAINPDFADPLKSLGEVTGNNFDIVSLGDLTQGQISSNIAPGEITLGFNVSISDKQGPDFAIFENALIDNTNGYVFAELAYVEVSSDGTNFARFPSISTATNLVSPFGSITVNNVYNLSGKHVNGGNESWGTPFDLSTLTCNSLVQSNIVDISDINYIRIIDIPGSGDFLDSIGNPIYDPWSTADFGSGGFDLEAVGIINSPQFANITTDAGMNGTITPYGMPNRQVAVTMGSNYTFNINPDTNYYVVNVKVDGVSIGITNNYTFINVTNDHAIAATFGHQLIVNTFHGTSMPVGTTYTNGNISVYVSQPIITEGATQYVCTGWIATGSITNGIGTDTGIFTINANTTISWLWQTNYLLTATATQGGTVTPENGWYPVGSNATVVALMDPYFNFVGWTGDVQGDTNSSVMTVAMNGPAIITANFYAELATNDTPVAWLEYYNLTNSTPDEEAMGDIDNDGMNAWEEYMAGTDPTDTNSVFMIIDFGEVSGSNYVTWLGGTNGSGVPFSIYTCESLMCTNWILVDGNVQRAPSGTNTWWQSSGNNANYYRIQVNK